MKLLKFLLIAALIVALSMVVYVSSTHNLSHLQFLGMIMIGVLTILVVISLFVVINHSVETRKREIHVPLKIDKL